MKEIRIIEGWFDYEQPELTLRELNACSQILLAINKQSTVIFRTKVIKIEAKKVLYQTNFIVPTFNTKVTEYLCWGWFFLSDKFRLFNSPFLTEFFIYHSKAIGVLIDRTFFKHFKIENVIQKDKHGVPLIHQINFFCKNCHTGTLIVA